MDIESRKKVLQIALDAICYKIGDTKMLFANLEIPMTAEGAAGAGLADTFAKYATYMETAGKIQRELVEIEAELGWRKLQALGGSVYICPFCDCKSPVNGAYCPECGRYVGKAVNKI